MQVAQRPSQVEQTWIHLARWNLSPQPITDSPIGRNPLEDINKKKHDNATVNKQREKLLQSIADRLNASEVHH